SGTTGESLSAVLFYLINSPRCLQVLRAEIENCQDASGNKQLTLGHLQKLPYLQAVIKESLRMHPATGFPMWRTVPQGGAEIQGVFFPENSVVGLNSWTAHYDEKVFDNAHEFRPERWLPNAGYSAERLKAMESYYISVSTWSPVLNTSRLCLILIVRYGIQDLYRTTYIHVGKDQIDSAIGDRTSSTMRARNHWFVKPDNLKMKIRLRSHM
ncbi:unnamed protein product, partial [Clonostachys chloroleuca]